MNKINFKKTLLIVVSLFIIVFIVLKLKNNKATSVNKVYRYNKELPIQVSTQEIALASINNNISFTGTFEPNRESKLSSEQPGKVNAVFCDLGTYVIQGQKLIQLDKSLLEHQLKSVEVQIQSLESEISRFEILAAAEAIQKVQLEKTEFALKAAKIQQSTIKEQIAKTTVYAPFNGVITAKLTETGSYAAPGVPLLQLTELSVLKFVINVSETDLQLFKIGQYFKLNVDALPETVVEGRVSMVGSKANMGNSFPIHFSIQNPEGNKIKAGMFGKLEVATGNGKQGIIIPSSVLIGNSKEPKVYLIKNGKAVLVNVTISQRLQDQVVVSSGLEPGDLLITNGFVNLFEGANVKPVNN